MASIFGMFETAKSGLSVAQQNLKITGHNIANADTAGYTRQRLNTSAIDPSVSAYLLSQADSAGAGRGVEALGVKQIRSLYLDDQFRELNADFNYSEYRTQALTYLEGLFDERDEDGGLTAAIQNFYSALNTLTQDSSSLEYRTNVQQQALALTEGFNIVYTEMKDLWQDQNDSIMADADEINSLADRISALNAAIAKYERSGETANDLRDDRNLLLDTLSGLVNISCGGNETNPSMVDVQIGGIDLVTGVSVNRVEADGAYLHTEQIDELTDRIASVNADIAAAAAAGDPTDELTAALDGYIEDLSQFVEISTAADADGVTNILFCGVYLVQGSAQADIASAVEPDMTAWAELYRNRLTLDGASLDIGAGTVTGGSLYAHMEMVRGADAKAAGIPDYMSRLNALARAVAQNVNTIHKMGFTYPADGMPSVDGVNFFNVALIPDGSGGYVEDYSRITAGNFALGDAVLESVYNIAAAAEPVDLSNPATESGNHEIISKLIADLDNSGYYGMLNSIVGHLATTLKSGRSILDTKASLLGSIDTQRTSVSGVSTDEETTNLIVYKQTYQACSRVITAIDEMINTLVNNTGLVGR